MMVDLDERFPGYDFATHKGYNTPDHIPEQPDIDHLSDFHHLLCMQAGVCCKMI